MVLIKQQPEDFYVEEIIDVPELKEVGEYTYFWLTKTNWTTVRALEQIAKRCGVSRKRFNFSGTKDKKAITKQLISGWNVDPRKLERVNLKDIEIKIAGIGSERINLGSHTGNKFKIVVRDVKSKPDLIKQFPNYFGVQRFGSSGLNHKIGLAILKGDFEKAAKILISDPGLEENEVAKQARVFAAENWGNWNDVLKQFPKFLSLEKSVLNHLVREPTDFAGALRKIHKKIRKLFIHAYQSYLFNEILSEKIKSHKHIMLDFLDSKLAFPKEEIDNFELPLIGFDSKPDKESEKLMEIDEISLDSFKCSRMPELASEGHTRNAFAEPVDLKISEVEAGSCIIEFELGTGEYATMLIKQLFS